MRRFLLAGTLALALLFCVFPAQAQEPMLVFDGCSILDSGTPWHDHVMYVFHAQAGADSVNDIHVCVYDEGGNELAIVAISYEGCWTGHLVPGENCAEFWSVGPAIPPWGSFGAFDIIMPPNYCVITVVWWYTYNDGPITNPQTVIWTCSYTGVANETWGAIKSLYR
jgi:hypothetical protein